jgi:uncharacterized Tic20 family protein
MSDVNPEENQPEEFPPEEPMLDAPETSEPQAQLPPPDPVVEPDKALPPPSSPKMLTASEENTWSLIAHLSILANLVTGFLGPIIALVIYFAFRDRSRYVAYQAFQSFLFQLIFWVGAGFLVGITWTLVGILSVVIVGICLIPLACLVSLIPVFALGYGIVGAIKAGQGEDFRYWLIGDWTRDILKS